MKYTRFSAMALAGLALGAPAQADILNFTDPSGLSAEAEFTMINATTVQIRLRNTSTGVPIGFSNSDQILTGLSWDAGLPGDNPGDPSITGGSAEIGANSASVNFDTGNYGPGTDIGGEWGYGNVGNSGAMQNAVSGNTAGITPFGGANLDGSPNLNGPQGGLVASPILVPMGGLGAIEDEIMIEITLDTAISGLSDLIGNGARVEFGSDAAFITVIPAPGVFGLLAPVALAATRRRR